MKQKHCWSVSLCLIAGCARGHQAANGVWPSRLPLAPPLHFAEAITPRSVVAMVVDAHSGAAVPYSVAIITSEGLAAKADSAGVIRLRLRHAGSFSVRVRGVGYELWQGTVTVTDTSGFAMLVQLHRSYAPLIPVIVEPEAPVRQPPDGR